MATQDIARLNPSLSVYVIKFQLERIAAPTLTPLYKGSMNVSAYTQNDAIHQVRTFLQYTTGLFEDGIFYPFTYPDEAGRKITMFDLCGDVADVSISGPANIRETTLPKEIIEEVMRIS